jgi:RNA polymerase sigma-70 factor (ECF subfamily)
MDEAPLSNVEEKADSPAPQSTVASNRRSDLASNLSSSLSSGPLVDADPVPVIEQTPELLALRAAQRGEAAGLTTLFRTHQPRLLRYLRAREPRLADDLASDTWLAVAQRLPTFEGGTSDFGAWLFTIARLRMMDARRTASRRRTDPVADIDEHSGASTEQIALQKLSAQDAVNLINGALTEDQAEVILLRTLGDLSVDQVADLLGHDAGWVRVTQHRATKRLADRYSERLL